MNVKEILECLRKGDAQVVFDNKNFLNSLAIKLLKNDSIDTSELDALMRICNIVYNNTDTQLQVIEDGVYDHLQELYKGHFPDYQVGSEVVQINNVEQVKEKAFNMIEPFTILTEEDKNTIDKMLYKDTLIDYSYGLIPDDLKIRPFNIENDISKRIISNTIEFPELVGTLDKCKFVLTSEAEDRGVVNDSNVKILERDFFLPLIEKGIINPNTQYAMDIELKYDGVSVEAACNNTVIRAGSRGDTGVGESIDLTPILEGYAFPRVTPDLFGDELGIKFEAIMTYMNLWKFNMMKGKSYKNCRTAIIGLMGSSDAWKYRDLITLVPLQMQNLKPNQLNDRLVEIEFLNKYYTTGEKLRSVYIEGDYKQLLFQIHKFAKEAEYARKFIPFMYDGIVVSFLDNNLRETLGRVNSVNKYSMAVKFEALKKQTEFLGYTYTVGQDGRITPMIHYNPVEFYGTIHPKSTGHSYDRFKKLNLIKGDILDVTYEDDVMPYVRRAENSFNDEQRATKEPEKFIENCPMCNTKLVLSETGKTIYCPNKNCPGRHLARTTSMINKLGIVYIAEESIKKLQVYTLRDLFTLDMDKLNILGEVNAQKLKEQLDNILYKDTVMDYSIMGALGFTSCAEKTWKLILNKCSLQELFLPIISSNIVDISTHIHNCLTGIKGIGSSTIQTIVDEFEVFKDDILFIMNNITHLVQSKGMISSKQIRFAGVRNKELMDELSLKGYDITGGDVMKSTNILLIPYEGYTSGKDRKTQRAVENGAILVPIQQFISNMDKYL